jgi:4-hydroxybenzoate polyprenyltransferase
MLLIIMDIVLTIFYSLPPKLKNIPLVPNIIVGTHYSLFPLLIGWTLLRPIQEAPIQIIGVVTLLASGVNMLEEFEDIEGDIIANVKTLPIIIGEKPTLIVINSIYLSSLFISIICWLKTYAMYWLLSLLQQFLLIFLILKLIIKVKKLNPITASKALKISSILAISINLTLAFGYIISHL